MRARTFALVGILGLATLFGCEPKKDAETPSTDTQATTEQKPEPFDVSKLPDKPANGEEVGVFETDKGRIVFMFYPQIAPNHVDRFKAMIKEGYYDGTRFHRCIPGFMVQGGDPYSRNVADAERWGSGGYFDKDGREVNINAEFNLLHHNRGVMSTARGDDFNSASSQFFIMQAENGSLDGQYTAWGKVMEGMDVVDKIVATGDPNANGKVEPSAAVVLKKATIQTWPLK